MTTTSVPRLSAARLSCSLLILGSVLAFAACGGDKSPTDNGNNKPPVDSTVPEPTIEVRALWLSRYDYSTQAQLVALIDSAAAANFNLVYFQARGNGDALYKPGLEPWYRSLTGTLGQDPGWDPLQVAIDRAHSRGLELHAWINVAPAWSNTLTLTESTPRHPLLVHPEWAMRDTVASSGKLLVDGSYQLFSPAAAGYRTHVARVAADIVRRYQVDGIHLDYIRYPYPDWWDKVSLDAWNAAGHTQSYDDFRRAQVTDIVKQVYDSMRAVRPVAR
ncbi:MAG TPA: family 10 glycosylhydrolase, partial [Longimicrobiales bacterium]